MDNKINYRDEIDLGALFHFLRARIFIIAFAGILLAAVAGIVTKYTTTPIYTSSTQLYILTKSSSTANLSDIQMGEQLTQDYLVLIKSRPVVNQVLANLKLNITYEQLANMISVSNPSGTRLIDITASYSDAYIVKRIVDEFAGVSIERIAQIMHIDKPTIVEEGKLPSYPSNGNTMKNVLQGGLLGCGVAAGILILLYLTNNTIKNEEDIERYLGLSTLAHIPVTTYSSKMDNLEIGNSKYKGRKRIAGRGLNKLWIKLNIFTAKKWITAPRKRLKP